MEVLGASEVTEPSLVERSARGLEAGPAIHGGAQLKKAASARCVRATAHIVV